MPTRYRPKVKVESALQKRKGEANPRTEPPRPAAPRAADTETPKKPVAVATGQLEWPPAIVQPPRALVEGEKRETERW